MKKAVRSKEPTENGNGKMRATTIRRSKLLIVDLAGSERVDKSGWLLDDVFIPLSAKLISFTIPLLHLSPFSVVRA